jgi:hypothetical protein
MLAGGRTSGVALYIRSSALDFQTASKSGLPDLQTSVFVSAMPCGPDHRQHFRSSQNKKTRAARDAEDLPVLTA